MSLISIRCLFLVMAIAGICGCGKTPLPRPQAGDWARRNLDGVSLEAPYEFTTNPNPLPGYVNIASYMPSKTPNALEVRIDVLQQPVGVAAPTLDQFAKGVFSVVEGQAQKPDEMKVDVVQVGELEGRRNKAQSSAKTYVESLVFKKGEFYWLIEVYFADETLSNDAKRVLDSVEVE
jgi:hypothetical protein